MSMIPDGPGTIKIPTSLPTGKESLVITPFGQFHDGNWVIGSVNYYPSLYAFIMKSYQLISRLVQNQVLSGVYIGLDSRSSSMAAVTDRTENVNDCQTLCKNTSNCKFFTFYFDGRPGTNCLLKTQVFKSELFVDPMAVTGDRYNTSAAARTWPLTPGCYPYCYPTTR